jgi:sulfoxide reductase catalytic subunit YedY
MFVRKHTPLDPVGGTETPEAVALNRRRWLKSAGLAAGAIALGGAGIWAWRASRGSDEDVIALGLVDSPAEPRSHDAAGNVAERRLDAPRDGRFTYGRGETNRAEAARYTNFYEFTTGKSVWRYVDRFQPRPWSIRVAGLCRNPFTLDPEELQLAFADHFVERQYRHRCVERWAMAVPWMGVPLREIIRRADPLAAATHVRFVTFHRPEQAANAASRTEFAWPYAEGLTLPEATSELTLLATGMYGRPLLKQHGAPVRLVVPWKYGYKSIKSIERIEFVGSEPATFWSTYDKTAYPFSSNVDPDGMVPWPQSYEEMLGSGELFATKPFNGYGEYVADLYA